MLGVPLLLTFLLYFYSRFDDYSRNTRWGSLCIRDRYFPPVIWSSLGLEESKGTPQERPTHRQRTPWMTAGWERPEYGTIRPRRSGWVQKRDIYDRGCNLTCLSESRTLLLYCSIQKGYFLPMIRSRCIPYNPTIGYKGWESPFHTIYNLICLSPLVLVVIYSWGKDLFM